MIKKYIFFFIGFLGIGILSAQTVNDALQFSQSTYDITARSAAMGSSFGALGGDFSSLSINPAGLGIYRSRESVFTPGLSLTKTTSHLSDKNTTFIISNIGYVESIKTYSENWKFINFGIGYNRTNDFNRDLILRNLNSGTSLTDIWADFATKEGLNAFNTELAYETFLINKNDDETAYLSILKEGDQVNQYKFITEDGYMGEVVLSAATNYKDFLYLGATLGISYFDYENHTRYNETATTSATTDLDYYNFFEYYHIKGYGVNFKLGAILRPSNYVRFGAAIHTPTFYNIDDDYSSHIDSKLKIVDDKGNNLYSYSSPLSVVDYDFDTPWKYLISAAFLYPERGVINVDVEFVDYTDTEFKGNDIFYGTIDNPGVNDFIKRQLKNVINFRIGGEIKLNDIFSLRGGYGHYGNPFNEDEVKADLSYNVYSAGLGYKYENFFADVSWQMRSIEDNMTFYSDATPIDYKTKTHQVKVSFGWKF